MEDQSRNQEMARIGSVQRNYATIDLSTASDTVTNSLVRYVFQDTSIWPWLWASRTRIATLDRETVQLEKFAPMGSAVCFPIESIVFAAVVWLAMERVGIHRDFVVYGDDIICHKDCFDEVIRLLKLFHFSVNEKKTFSPESPFKESCGKEFYYGVDVTPFRIPRFFSGFSEPSELKGKPQLLDSWVSVANRLYASGLYLARAYLVHRLLHLVPNVLFTERYSGGPIGLVTSDATNFHLPERFEDNSSNLNRKQVNWCRGRLVKAITARAKTGLGSDEIRYQMLLETYSHTRRSSLVSPQDLIDLKVGPSEVHLKTGWFSGSDIRELVGWMHLRPSGDRDIVTVFDGAEWSIVF